MPVERRNAGERYAVVSCHVERPLDEAVWREFAAFQERRPGGFAVAALMRPPDRAAREDDGLWLARARDAAARGPLGLHTHWTSPSHARPTGGDPADKVRADAMWMRERGLGPAIFCGGGWYIDEPVARTVAELGLADCTGTAFRPPYLERDAPRLAVEAPARLQLADGSVLLEVPTTHSIGMLVRGVFGRLQTPLVHAYFHDTDLLDRSRRTALVAALIVLARRRRPVNVSADLAADAPKRDFRTAASAR